MRVREGLLVLSILAMSFWAGAGLAAPNPVVSDATQRAHDDAIAAINAEFGEHHSFALVIGVSEFNSSSWHDLGGVGEEVQHVSDALADRNFEVETGPADGRVSLELLGKTISDFIVHHGQDPDNRLVIYIATHGFADAEGKGYLIASDSGAPENGAITGGYSVDNFGQALSYLKSLHVFVFLDSCFSAAMLPQYDINGGTIMRAPADIAALGPETVDRTRDLLSHYARMVLTAGQSDQAVPDRASPFASAVVDALEGKADTDNDGLTLGSEIAQFVRGRVSRESRHPDPDNANDPVFAMLPHPSSVPDGGARSDAPPNIDYAIDGDFVFLTPATATAAADDSASAEAAGLAARQARLDNGQFTECVDCPTMTALTRIEPGLALAITETTYAQWDACFREGGCHRYLADDGLGRGDRPAGGMTWQDALEYVQWLNETRRAANPDCDEYRLPTAAEWLAAALYSSGGEVKWSTAVADDHPVCWGCGPGQDGVASLRTASFGYNGAHLYDMIGNLWEWVSDDAASVQKLLDPAEDTGDKTLSASAAAALRPECTTNSLNPQACGNGAVMGGSYATRADALNRSIWGAMPRSSNVDPYALPTVGLRVACMLHPAA